MVVPQRVPANGKSNPRRPRASRTGWAPSASRYSAARGSRRSSPTSDLCADLRRHYLMEEPDRADAGQHRHHGRTRRLIPRGVDVEATPIMAMKVTEHARDGVHRAEPRRIARSRRRAPTCSSTRSSKTPGGGWSSTRKKLEDYRRGTFRRAPLTARNQPDLDQQRAAPDPATGRVDQSRDKDRAALIERSIADLASPDANPEVSTAIAGGEAHPGVRYGATAARRGPARPARNMELRLKPEASRHPADEAVDPRPAEEGRDRSDGGAAFTGSARRASRIAGRSGRGRTS